MLPAEHDSGEGEGHQPSLPILSTEKAHFPSLRPASSRLALDVEASTPATVSPSASTRSSVEGSRSRDSRSPALPTPFGNNNDPRNIILKSSQAKIAVFASSDTEELVRLKGIYGGFCGLLRPFGESVQGKVVIRDSVGASKSWNDFGVRFVEFGNNATSLWPRALDSKPGLKQTKVSSNKSKVLPGSTSSSSPSVNLSPVDEVVERHIFAQKSLFDDKVEVSASADSAPPPYYSYYLKKLLADRPMVPHEPLSQPVACVIAISSQCANPIERLRELYSETRQGDQKLPAWAGDEYLRYYVLVHDEDHDDISRSTALFDQMKRHFGLHCHLLRLRSIECGPAEEDSTQMPDCEWLSAAEDLQDMERRGNHICIGLAFGTDHKAEQDAAINDYKQYVFDTDAAILRTFVREMVTQSVLPFMESRVTTWNDQVASRRRGISGRFMSLSKRWVGFGGNRVQKPSPSNSTATSGSNYNSTQGYYVQDSPEALMHRLADYAFILRDWKLSSSIYDILRTDFGDDKAWKHHAIAHEMMAMSLLLAVQTSTLRSRVDTIDQMLDAASYSYITRCADTHGAIRCLTVAVELYKSRGGTAVEDAAKWADRLLELSVMSPLAQSLLTERLALCYTSQPGIGLEHWGSRNRKAGFWKLLSSDVWLQLRKHNNAKSRLFESARCYETSTQKRGLPHFLGMQEFWLQIEKSTNEESALPPTSPRHWGITQKADTMDEESENLDAYVTSPERRMSLFLKGQQSPGIEAVNLLQQLNDPLDQANDGFV